jgi:hypothetical protein
MKKLSTILILSLAVQLCFGQNEQLIEQRERFVFWVDSLEKCCKDSLERGHGHGINEETGIFNVVSSLEPRNTSEFDSLFRVARQTENEYDKNRLLDKVSPWSLYSVSHINYDTRESHTVARYRQYRKLVAIRITYRKEQIAVGKIILYINDGKIIYYEEIGEVKDNKQSIAQEYNLTY